MPIAAKLDEWGLPAWIALMVLSFGRAPLPRVLISIQGRVSSHPTEIFSIAVCPVAKLGPVPIASCLRGTGTLAAAASLALLV